MSHGGVARRQQAPQTRQSGIPGVPAGVPVMPGMAGPLHADFVRQHNMASRAVDADAILLIRFVQGRR